MLTFPPISYLSLNLIYTDHILKHIKCLILFITKTNVYLIFTSSHCSKPAVTFQGAFPMEKMGFYRYKCKLASFFH